MQQDDLVVEAVPAGVEDMQPFLDWTREQPWAVYTQIVSYLEAIYHGLSLGACEYYTAAQLTPVYREVFQAAHAVAMIAMDAGFPGAVVFCIQTYHVACEQWKSVME